MSTESCDMGNSIRNVDNVEIEEIGTFKACGCRSVPMTTTSTTLDLLHTLMRKFASSKVCHYITNKILSSTWTIVQ